MDHLEKMLQARFYPLGDSRVNIDKIQTMY